VAEKKNLAAMGNYFYGGLLAPVAVEPVIYGMPASSGSISQWDRTVESVASRHALQRPTTKDKSGQRQNSRCHDLSAGVVVSLQLRPRLVSNFSSNFTMQKKRFSITSKY
jgi:hypothetical protein